MHRVYCASNSAVFSISWMFEGVVKNRRQYVICAYEMLTGKRRKLGLFPSEKIKKAYTLKPYEQSAYSSADFLKKLIKWYARRGILVECV